MYLYICAFIFLLFIIVICYLSMSKSLKKKSKKHPSDITEYDLAATILHGFLNNKNLKANKKDKIYLKYYDDISRFGLEPQYLTWRFAGSSIDNIYTYNLTLLPYKNKQNQFKLHKKDYFYLKPFYEKLELYDSAMQEQLNNLMFVTSDYNINKDQYLELIEIQDDMVIIKASLWCKKGPDAYLHIDDKNKLFFDSGIHNNVAVFTLI